MTTLFIDTSSDQSKVALMRDGYELASDVWESAHNLGADLLPHIYSLLKKNGIETKQLAAIAVHPGPGSFTGLRVGITTANTLAFSLNIPVMASVDLQNIDLKLGAVFTQTVTPHYGAPPSITIPNTRL